MQVASAVIRPGIARAVIRTEPRGGLAPLEMVLSLPILLFVMGLMLLIGMAGGWKLRTQINSRQAAFRSLEPRTGTASGLPQGLPQTTEMSYTDPNRQFLSSDPFAEFTVIRGPVLTGAGNNGGNAGQPIPVNTQLFDMTLGYRQGHTRIRRNFPILGQLPPRQFDFTRETVVLDGTLWQYHTQQISSNTDRRIPYLYNFQLETMVPQLTSGFQSAAINILQNPRRTPDLTPLEGEDPELLVMVPESSPDFARRYSINVNYRQTYDRRRYPAPLVRDPPRVVSGRVPEPGVTRSGNLFDPEAVRRERVEPYKHSVTHSSPPSIPRAMSQHYIRRYREQIQRLQGMTPPPQDQIDALQEKIDQLNSFIGSLPL